MPTHTAVQISKPPAITADDLHDAYLFARLRRLGIGYLQAIETPSIYAALRGTTLARKKQQHGKPAPDTAGNLLVEVTA